MDFYVKKEETDVSVELTGSSSNSAARKISGGVRRLGTIVKETTAVLHSKVIQGKLSGLASLKQKLSKNGVTRAMDASYADAEQIYNQPNPHEQIANGSPSSSLTGADGRSSLIVTGQQERVNVSVSVDVECVQERPSIPGIPTKTLKEESDFAETAAENLEETPETAEMERESIGERLKTDVFMHLGGSSCSISDSVTDNREMNTDKINASSAVLCDVEGRHKNSQPEGSLSEVENSTTELSLYIDILEEGAVAYTCEKGSSNKGNSGNSRRKRISGRVTKLRNTINKTYAVLRSKASGKKVSTALFLEKKFTKNNVLKTSDTISAAAAAEETRTYQGSLEQTLNQLPLSSSVSEACVRTVLKVTGQGEGVGINGSVDIESVEEGLDIPERTTTNTEEGTEIADIATKNAEGLPKIADALTDSKEAKLKTDIFMDLSGSTSSIIIDGLTGNQGRSDNFDNIFSLLCDAAAENNNYQEEQTSDKMNDLTADIALYSRKPGKAAALCNGETGSSNKGRRSGDIRESKIRGIFRILSNTTKKTKEAFMSRAFPETLSALAFVKKKFSKRRVARTTDAKISAAEENIHYYEDSQEQTANALPSSSVSGAWMKMKMIMTAQGEGVATKGLGDVESTEGSPDKPETLANTEEDRSDIADVTVDGTEDIPKKAEIATESVEERMKKDAAIHLSESSSSSINDSMRGNRGMKPNNIYTSCYIPCDVEAESESSQQETTSLTMKIYTADLFRNLESIENVAAVYAGEVDGTNKGSSNNTRGRRIDGGTGKLGTIMSKTGEVFHLKALAEIRFHVASLKRKLSRKGLAK